MEVNRARLIPNKESTTPKDKLDTARATFFNSIIYQSVVKMMVLIYIIEERLALLYSIRNTEDTPATASTPTLPKSFFVLYIPFDSQ